MHIFTVQTLFTVLRPLSPLFSLSFFSTSAETERKNEMDIMEQNFHALTVTAFHYMPLDKPNGILTVTLKS